VDNFLATLLYGHHDPLEGMHEGEPVDLDKAVVPFDTGETPIDPIGAFLAKNERDLLTKTAGVADELWDAPLTKTAEAPLEKREVFFEKRSSGPGRIRFQIEHIEGFDWRCGYNHLGERERMLPA
jgi:hypothetical protein